MRRTSVLLAAVIASATATLAADALAADECTLARQVSRLDVASKLLLAETDPAGAAALIERMTRALRALEEAGPPDHPATPGSPVARMVDYVGSRAELVRIFADRGLPAVQAFLHSAANAAADNMMRNIELRLGCGEPDSKLQALGKSAQRTRQLMGARLVDKAPDAGDGPLATTTEDRWKVLLGALAALVALAVALARLMNHRHFPRYPCDIPAQLTLAGETLNGRIADISRNGAKIRIDNTARAGSPGSLHLQGEKTSDFKVVWANSHFIGVVFHPRLGFSPKTLLGV